MSELQDFVDENEIGYQYAMLDIKNAIDAYGIEILLEAIANYVNDNVELDLTNIVVPDTMYVQ
jgi:hypothetical protein